MSPFGAARRAHHRAPQPAARLDARAPMAIVVDYTTMAGYEHVVVVVVVGQGWTEQLCEEHKLGGASFPSIDPPSPMLPSAAFSCNFRSLL